MSEKPEIDKIRKSNLVIRGILLEILRNYFSQLDGQFKYDSDKEKTLLVIEPAYMWDPKDCQNRPGLYVEREDMNFRTRHGRAGMNDVYAKKDTKTEYAVFCDTPLIVQCVSKLGGEAELLAEKTSGHLQAYAPVIRKDFCFQEFYVATIGKLQQYEESKEYYTTPIVIVTQFSEKWRLVLEALPLKDIFVKLTAKDA